MLGRASPRLTPGHPVVSRSSEGTSEHRAQEAVLVAAGEASNDGNDGDDGDDSYDSDDSDDESLSCCALCHFPPAL